MKRNLWVGLILLTAAGMAAADPQAKVRKVSDHENSYTYYNWKPNKPKPQPAAAAGAAPTAPAASAPVASPAYTPVQPSPAVMNPAMAPEYNPGYNALPPQQLAPPAYNGPQSYYSSPYFSSGYYSSGYSYPGLQVSNSGFYNGLSVSGVYRNGNVTVRAGSPGFYGPGFNSGFYGPGSGFYGPGSGSGFYGPGAGFNGGGGFHHGGGHHR